MSQNELHDISPKSASQMLHDDPRAILIDIRSSMEFLFVGHPVGAVHLPWIDEPDWVVNPHFVPEVRKLMLGGVVQGSQNHLDSGFTSYGDNSKTILGYNGTPMPAFAADLTAEELISVVFYERIELGGYSDDLEFAELVWDKIEHGELELPDHFVEGTDGDFTAEIEAILEEVRLELGANEEIASE